MSKHDPKPSPRLLDEFTTPDAGQWRAEVERLLKGASFDRRMFTRTLEGLTVGPMGTAADTESLPWPEHAPGEAPFLRGATAAGCHGAPWLVAQELPLPTAAAFNEALRHDLERGQTAVNLALDEAGRRGCDPDTAPAGTVGSGGTSLATLADLATALAGVDLAVVPLQIRTGTAALPVAAMVAALARRGGHDPAVLRGMIGFDPLGGLARKGALPVSLAHAFDQLAALTRWSAAAPQLRTLPVCEDPWHDGGADSALSLGLLLSGAVAVLRALEERGIAPDEAAARIQFNLELGGDFFMEMAKIRALRLLWSDVQAAAGIVPAPAWIHARTSRRTQTVLDPHVNMLRATTQAMSGVLGGVQSLHVAPFDEVDSLPDEFSRRIARNVQLLLAHECHFDQVADPAGGSWYVEKLTADLAERSWAEFRDVEGQGGLPAVLAAGTVQSRIEAVAEERRARLATRRDVIVGTNRYANPTETTREPRRIDQPALQRKRAAELVSARSGEDSAAGLADELRKLMADDPAALVAHLATAAEAGATLGELAGALRRDDRPQTPVAPIPLRRDAAPFEELRGRVAAAALAVPRDGRVACVCLGDPARYMPRLDFVRGFFAVGGFAVVAEGFADDARSAAAAAGTAAAATCVIVGLDETYAASGASVARALKALTPPPRVLLAGQPGDLADDLRAAGVDGFIHLKSDILAELGLLAATKEGE